METFFSPSEQTIFFLYSVIMGAGIGILFDCFRVARIILEHTAFFVILEDIIFLFLWAVALIVFSMELCRGEVRFYYFIGNILGFAVYYFTVGKLVVSIMKAVVFVISKILKFLYKLFIRPILILLILIRQILHNVFVTIYSKLKIFANRIKIYLKKKHDLMYNKATRNTNKKEVTHKVEKSKTKKPKQRLRSP